MMIVHIIKIAMLISILSILLMDILAPPTLHLPIIIMSENILTYPSAKSPSNITHTINLAMTSATCWHKRLACAVTELSVLY
jgi:hypothetical protein